jgi:ribosomal protein S18 acetylase RimI-like enzyme
MYLEKTLAEKQGICLLAYADDKPIGLLCGWVEQPDEPIMDKEEPAYGYIGEGVVHPDWQRHGVYQKLAEEAEKYFKECGLKHLRTTALNNNSGIIAFLNKNGFSPYYTCFEKKMS